MDLVRFFTLSLCMAIMGLFEAIAQSESKMKVDPGYSVNNYKHPNKAAKAKKMQAQATPRRFASRVGIVKRSTNVPAVATPHETPKYAKRRVWVFFKRSPTAAPHLNPLTNPNHYKLNMGY